MSATMPNCTKCGTPYSTPSHYSRNDGLCETCRPIKLCSTCKGAGQLFIPSKKNPRMGKWSECAACSGSRHEPCVSLSCLACGKADDYPLTSNEANGVFNVFCDGECEDRYAARQ